MKIIFKTGSKCYVKNLQILINDENLLELQIIQYSDKVSQCVATVEEIMAEIRGKHKDLAQECENELKTLQLSKDVHNGEAEEHKEIAQKCENELKTPQVYKDVHSREAGEHKDAEQPSLIAMAASISRPFSTGLASSTDL